MPTSPPLGPRPSLTATSGTTPLSLVLFVANATLPVDVVFKDAMPDTNYVVAVTFPGLSASVLGALTYTVDKFTNKVTVTLKNSGLISLSAAGSVCVTVTRQG